MLFTIKFTARRYKGVNKVNLNLVKTRKYYHQTLEIFNLQTCALTFVNYKKNNWK
jgi:hypothetical protein